MIINLTSKITTLAPQPAANSRPLTDFCSCLPNLYYMHQAASDLSAHARVHLHVETRFCTEDSWDKSIKYAP